MKQTIRRLSALLMALCLVCALGVNGHAASGMSNFVQQNDDFSAETFADVAPTDWSYPSIRTCYEYGLMIGQGENLFAPTGNLKVSEALTMADRVYAIYHTGGELKLEAASPWYRPYVDYAIQNGIIQAGDFSSSDYNRAVTRAEMAYIISGALPGVEFAEVKTVSEIPDIADALGKYRDSIWLLYRAGVLLGNDVYGTFLPNSNITRQEAAAIIARVAIPAERRLDERLLQRSMQGFTFGLPQSLGTPSYKTGKTVDNYPTYMYIAGGQLIVEVCPNQNEKFSGCSLPDLETAEQEQTLLEAASYNNCTTTQVNFGGIHAFRTEATEDGYPVVVYRFISGSTLYRFNIAWTTSLDAKIVQMTLNSVRFGGYAASPAYTLP